MRFYGLLSNSVTAALVSADGSIDWLPFPRYDCPTVFARLLGGDRHGYFRVRPDTPAVSHQHYVSDTNVLQTIWTSPKGQASIHDYLTIGRTELRRLITTEIALAVELRPRFHYGLVGVSTTPAGSGAILRNPLGSEALVFAINGRPSDITDAVLSNLSQETWWLPPGHYELILRYIADDKREANHTVDSLLEEALGEETGITEQQLESEGTNRFLTRTVRYWRSRVPALVPELGLYRESWVRSLLVLNALTYRTNGAIIAAPTTSLPEAVGETRQWDYRFAWVRDGSFAAEALLQAGDPIACRRFLEFLFNCVDLGGKPFPAPFFHVDGTLIRGERELGGLPYSGPHKQDY